VGFHKGDYASWFGDQGKEFQENVLGPGRFKLYDEGKVGFKGFADDTGRLKPIKELEGKIPAPTNPPAPSGPIETPAKGGK